MPFSLALLWPFHVRALRALPPGATLFRAMVDPDRNLQRADEYEARYMQGEGSLLRRERTVWGYHWLLLTPIPFCLALAAMILAGVGSRPAPLPMALLPLGVSALMALLWALFRVLRVHVTDREVHVQYGIFGPRIPVDAILSCQVVDYDWTRYGGWGIRWSHAHGWAYTLAGDSGRVVEVTWREGDASRKIVVSSLAPEALAASIQQAREGARPQLRVPSSSGLSRDDEGDEALAAAEPQEPQGARGRAPR